MDKFRKKQFSSIEKLISLVTKDKSKQKIIVLSSPDKADKLFEEIKGTINCLHIPHFETLPYDFFSPSKRIINQRLTAFAQLKNKSSLNIVTSIQALIDLCPPKESLFSVESLEVNKPFDRNILIKELLSVGYKKTDLVEELGEFATRGQIIDIFACGNRLPIRIEEFDNEIISLRTFNPKNQSTVKKIDSISILPPNEFMFNKKGVNLFKKNWRLRFEEDEDDCEIFNSLSNLKETEGGEIYSKLFFNEPTYLIDYLNDNHEFYLEDSWVESLNSFYELIHSRYENYKFDSTRPLLSPDEVYLDKEYITNLIHKKISTSFCFSRSPKIEVKEKEDSMNSSVTKVTNEYLPQLGEKVVHLQHGIGIFNGLKQIKANDVVNECLEIEYLNESKVFVPINDISKVNKFHGPEDTKINQLGSKRWKKRKSEALKRTFDVAAELLEIKARRNSKEGFSYQYPVKEYDEFKKLFPYQETPDQIKTIEEVERDLNSKQLTDRLICGEVGFGKTEVALRASFIAAYNSKQVCLLVPTTLLAQQHYETFTERFKDFPIKIAKLSRDLSKKQRDLVIKDLKSGNIDIIIGTHALIQKQNEFKDLGLLIIDEEHRFGVKQKEKIVSMKEDVEILSLSATPIPRSMNLSLAKLKDLSIISTPPSNRISVKTFVHSYNENLIKEAIQRELLRGGQIYYLCNDLKVIEDRKQRLEENFPKQKVEIIHGQLKSRDIEERMINFLENKTQILVCSTIIESGIDISNANTLIVEDADMLGLAQLHQLRGRVGRGKKQAFAYFLRSKQIKNKSKSNKRLKALKDSNSLSAGFLLAMKDLEIRGAGEILGSNQSGICESIGIDLYLKLLNRATDFIERGVLDFEYLDRSEVEVDLGRSSYIPEEYVSEINIRLIFYNKIATATTLKDLKDIKIEMIDRFGLFPDELRSLFLEAEIRISSPENLKSVTFKDQKVMLKRSDKVETINLERFTKLDDKVNFLIENNL